MGTTTAMSPVEGDRLLEGVPDTLGSLLEGCRQYLMLVAEHALGADLLGKVGASDLVQETFLEAQRHTGGFRGRSRDELLAWLRRILECRVMNTRRRFLWTQKRAGAREIPLEGLGPQRDRVAHAIVCNAPSPSQHALRNELAVTLERALGRLPERYRQVVLWRHQGQLTFQEIGQRIGGTDEAARKLWGRAIVQLRRELDEEA